MNSFEIFQKVLRYAFYILAALTFLCGAADYFSIYHNELWLYLGLAAVGSSLVRFVLRLM